MISVVIPTYNEKKNILKISIKLLKINTISEIIFVDDQSEDKTYEEIASLKNKKVKAFLRKSNKKDLSKSVLLGVQKAKHENILVMDCDLQHDPKYIKKMWKKFNKHNYDIVVANRFIKKKIIGNLGYFRSFISLFTISLIHLIFGKRVSDPLSGFFLCKKNIILNYKVNFFSCGYKILFDIIYNGRNNLKIGHQNIAFNNRKYEKSKFNWGIILIFLKQMIYTKFVAKKK
jgi:dolichol-phosphate mannosyltransferase